MGKTVGGVLGGALGMAAGMELGAAAATILIPGVGPVLMMTISSARNARRMRARPGAVMYPLLSDGCSE